MVKNPKRLVVTNLPSTTVTIPNHPTKDLGKRNIAIDENFYLSSDDTKDLKPESMIRLMGVGNVKIKNVSDHLTGDYAGDELVEDYHKVQWVSQKNFHRLKIHIPKTLFIDDTFNEDSLEELEVFVEPHYINLKEGSEIQFVRFGYCRKESSSLAIFTHK